MSDNLNKHPRTGKTRRDHANGAWARHLHNQQLRREWNQAYAAGAKSGGVKVLPYPEIGK